MYQNNLNNRNIADRVIIRTMQMQVSQPQQRLMQFHRIARFKIRARGSMDEIRNRDEIPSRSWLNYSQSLSILAKQQRELACR